MSHRLVMLRTIGILASRWLRAQRTCALKLATGAPSPACVTVMRANTRAARVRAVVRMYALPLVAGMPALALVTAMPVLAQVGPRAEIEPAGIAANGAVTEWVALRIEEEPTGRLVPLLPYIFFAEGSARIPSRYLDADSAWTTDRFVRRYRSILSIVGERLRDNPAESIVLTGTSSMTRAERRARNLARERAEAIASYLSSHYAIARSRLVTRSRGLPELASNNGHEPGRAENCRVELSGSALVLRPIEVADTLARVSSPGIRMTTDVQSPNGIRDWAIELRHDGKLFRRLSGHSQIGSLFAETFTDSELRWFAQKPDGIDVSLMVRDSTGDSVVTPRRTIQFQVERSRRLLGTSDGRAQDRESIVLFDFDSAELRDESRIVLLDLLGRIPPQAILTLTGFTDEVGDDERNLDLSKRRADTVAAAIPGRVASAGGAGESGGHHWNTTPEDRFYSRVVRMMVNGY